jgi:hypothetical protein
MLNFHSWDYLVSIIYNPKIKARSPHSPNEERLPSKGASQQLALRAR